MATFHPLLFFYTVYALLCFPSLSNELPYPKADPADTGTVASGTPGAPLDGGQGESSTGAGQSGPIAMAVLALLLLLLLASSCAIKIAGGVSKDQRLLQQQVEGTPHQGPHGFGQCSPDLASNYYEPYHPSPQRIPLPPPYQAGSGRERAQREMGWGREVTWRREERGHISMEELSPRSGLQCMSVFTISGQLDLPTLPLPTTQTSPTTPALQKLPPPYSVQDPCSLGVCH